MGINHMESVILPRNLADKKIYIKSIRFLPRRGWFTSAQDNVARHNGKFADQHLFF